MSTVRSTTRRKSTTPSLVPTSASAVTVSVNPKPRVSLAEFVAGQSAATAVAEQVQVSGDDLEMVPDEAKVLATLAELKRVSAEAKALYQLKDELEAKLFGELGMKAGDQLVTPEGDKVSFVDNFDGKNIHWGHASVRRFEVKFK